jgi:hypothetical protein
LIIRVLLSTGTFLLGLIESYSTGQLIRAFFTLQELIAGTMKAAESWQIIFCLVYIIKIPVILRKQDFLKKF